MILILWIYCLWISHRLYGAQLEIDILKNQIKALRD